MFAYENNMLPYGVSHVFFSLQFEVICGLGRKIMFMFYQRLVSICFSTASILVPLHSPKA